MRLDFNILWVEDQKAAVEAQKQRLERLIRIDGFRLRVEFAASVEQALTFLNDDIFVDHVDLVLMDYDLGVGQTGDQGLIEIKRTMPYKDVVFYSAQANNLREILNNARVDGVYLSGRPNLPEVAHGIFQTLVKKVVDIDHSRGIVMGATSDIDYMVNECLLRIFEDMDGGERQQALTLVRERIEGIQERFVQSIDAIKSATDMAQVVEHHMVYTSVDRLNLLRKILKTKGVYLDEEKKMVTYGTDVMPKRNDLAHKRVKVIGFSRRLVDRGGNELTSDAMKELRLLILQHHELFESLLDSLSPSTV